MAVILFFLGGSINAKSQAWSTFLDPSRAIDFTSAGFSIPNYTTNCATQPSLATGSGNASANATAIQNALASCDATHNVVNVPAGTYYVAGILYPYHGQQVLRGAGPTQTKLISTAENGCGGSTSAGFCMISQNYAYDGSSQVLPPSGTQQCLWTGGLTQGSTTITLTSCGGAPPNNHLILLDQANDTGDTGGVYICNEVTSASCNYDGTGSATGRTISGKTHTEIQTTYVTNVVSNGGGSYTVTISPGVYFTNVRSGTNAGAWWSDAITLDGLENMTIDGTSDPDYILTQFDCYHCWAQNVTFLNAGRAAVLEYQSGFNVIRNNYFYQAQGHQQISYNIEAQLSSGVLVENNIMQQTTTPITINNGTGWVIDYNFGVADTAFSGYTWPAFVSHNAGNNFNLWEGNIWPGLEGDDAWGAPDQQTYYRNLLSGWSSQGTNEAIPIIHRSYVRNFNVVANVLGQPGYHTQYQAIATGNTTSSGFANESASIYSLGLAGPSFTPNGCGTGTPQTSPFCDALGVSTLMRWGNYDTVNAAVRENTSEGCPAANTYVAANCTNFTTPATTFPASFYYGSTPAWWPSGKNWPPIGPDVTTGNVGICASGTYAGSQATNASQCVTGSLTTSWASHATSIPAMDCYLTTLGGKPDGSGSSLAFDANTCYSSAPTFSWTATIVGSGSLTGTNCSNGSYASGSTIGACTAAPGTGYSFSAWSAVSGSAACSGSTNPCPSFTLSANSAATATFTVNSYTLSTATAGSGSGSITGCAGSHNYGATYTCTVTPSAGSTLTSVSGCGGSGTTTYTGTMPASACTVTATFSITSYTLGITATNGSVSGTNCSAGTYNYNTAIGPCTATPNTGYSFTGWSGTGSCSSASGTGTVSCTITSNSTLTAAFSVNSYTLSTATTGTGSGTIAGCAGAHNYGATYTCTITPNSGSTLTGVSGCGGSGTTTYTGTMPASACTVTATFTQITPTAASALQVTSP